ncbi:DUF4306 domain-containing protein [Peribacillus muralis]|uniref:DUF4306 domain-containing protein n=1 Tax=Peribacillus muralis TaxID=264697 RepID=UPI001F4E188B|nr:DUF4306 domain-containing protein [Peribacillus muralis]MCK1994788.1 YjdJ family protein [Peribacillus muralis]MCK2015385.1 YjdJ family protein [Peribacillus muralis]
MTFTYFSQMIITALFFMLFSFCTWYEGSEILDTPGEWKYSTYFSAASGDQLTDADDISNLDYFVYAAKFKPLFPVLMIFTASYMIMLTGYIFFKTRMKNLAVFMSGSGVLFLVSSGLLSNSPTIGGTVFQAFFLISGMISIIAAALCYFRIPKGFVTVK